MSDKKIPKINSRKKKAADPENGEELVRHEPHTELIAKILCVIAAFCLWIYVMQVESPEYEETFSHIIVNLTNTDKLVSEKGLAIYNGYGTMIDVTFSGKKSVISKLEEKDIVATADVSVIDDGGSRYDVRINVDVPAGCKLVGMSQDTISVYFDKAGQTAVDLTEIRENTNLPEDCYTGVVEFPVDKVTIKGPSKVLESIDRAVVNLDLTGVSGTVSMTEEVFLLDRNGEEVTSPYIEYYPREVAVTVPVYKRATIPVEVYFRYGFLNADNATLIVNPMTVNVTGDPAVIDAGNLLEPIIIDEKTDFDGDIFDHTIRLDFASGVSGGVEEVDVTAVMDESLKTRELTVPGKNIEDTGGKDGVSYTWDHSPVTVTLCGPLENITQITPEDIILRLNMSPYSETNTGTIKVRAEVVIDSAYADGVFETGIYEIDVTFEN